MLASPRLLERFDQVLEDVIAVGDLDRLGSAAGGTVGTVRSPVATHAPDLWLVLQPGCAGVGLSVGEQVDNLVAFEIDQDCRVGLAAAQPPIVDTHDVAGRSDREGGSPHGA
jgi:hypothetical protein